MPYGETKVTPVKTSYSQESLTFRRLEKRDKYKKLIEFCETHNQTPRTYKRPEDERVLGQFLVNSRALAKRGSGLIEKWEHDYLDKVTEYEVYQRNPTARLNEILTWSAQNEKTPSQSSHDKIEKKLGQSLNSIKLLDKKERLTVSEHTILLAILEYRTNHQRTRDEKLGDVLEFCRQENRTPKQHVKNKNEKRLAEFLTTTKGLMKNPEFNLDSKSQKLFDAIMGFAPLSRLSRIKELFVFAKKHQVKPSTRSEDENERRLAAYLSKMKTALKRKQLNEDEAELVGDILTLCHIKTREEKLNDLLQWVLINDTLPAFSSDDTEEKRLAMFMNNIKQVQKKRPKSLSIAESNMITSINSCIKKKQGI